MVVVQLEKEIPVRGAQASHRDRMQARVKQQRIQTNRMREHYTMESLSPFSGKINPLVGHLDPGPEAAGLEKPVIGPQVR